MSKFWIKPKKNQPPGVKVSVGRLERIYRKTELVYTVDRKNKALEFECDESELMKKRAIAIRQARESFVGIEIWDEYE